MCSKMKIKINSRDEVYDPTLSTAKIGLKLSLTNHRKAFIVFRHI